MANTKQQNINIDKIKKSMYNICQILYKYVYKNLQFKDKINNKSNKNQFQDQCKTILIANPVILNPNSQKTNMANSFDVQK